MTYRLALIVVPLSLTGCASGCNQDPPPTSATCEPAPGAPRPTVSLIEIGRGPYEDFTPFEPGSVVGLELGGQGSNMIVAQLRITGTGLSTCIAQSTRLEVYQGEVMSSEESALQAYAVAPTTYITGAILLPWYNAGGQLARIESTVAGTTADVVFWADYMGEVDALPADAPPPD